MNTVNGSPSFKSKESWYVLVALPRADPLMPPPRRTMICLPVFEKRGFMYAYVWYITASVTLVLLSPKQSAFHDMVKVDSPVVDQ
jgi:hypothetical protein